MSEVNAHQAKDVVSVWDAVARRYTRDDYWAGPENRANFEVILAHSGDPRGKRIIEVGCGSGFTSVLLAETGAECALLDISGEALNVARAAFAQAGLAEPRCYNEDALDNHVPSGAFDVVWNGGVIEHFDDDGKRKLIREMWRMAKPGGVVVILVPNAWCWPFQWVQAWQKWRGTWPYGFEDDMSPRRLRRMCEHIGLDRTVTYAFNPILGWRWIPALRRVLKLLRLETLERHSRRCWMGAVSVLVIEKAKD